MNFNTTYLNKTPNKWPRRGADFPSFVVWHETASPHPDNPYGTLNYNLAAAVESSYHYLIARDGTIFHYVDEQLWIAYHAGVNSRVLGYVDWQVNVYSIGVEVDGPNNGTPITVAQRDAIVNLMVYFRDTYAIPLHPTSHYAHKDVAPGYKTDPRAYNVAVALSFALASTQPVDPAVFRIDLRFRPAWELSGGVWERNRLTPGYPTSAALERDGAVIQSFERGVARLSPDGSVSWLLLSEIEGAGAGPPRP